VFPAEASRVAYVLKQYPRYSETFIVNEILAHEAAGLNVEIYSLRSPTDGHFQDRIAQVRAPVNYLPEGGKANDFWRAVEQAAEVLPNVWSDLELARGAEAREVFQALLLARDVRRKGIAHLHAHFASVATTVARLASQFAGLPYTFTAHAKDIFHEQVQAADLRQKLRDAAGVVTVSDFNGTYLRTAFGDAAANVRRIYNGLDLDQFHYAAPSDRPPWIVSVGRLVEKKGVADLIDACRLLADRGCDFVCRIIGDGELDAALRDQIRRLDLQPQVEMLGPRPQAEVIQLVQGAAVLAVPCVVGADGNRDGLPTVLLEAMALGTPCVSTDVTGIPEVVHHGHTGLIVPQHDAPALAAALERLLLDSELRVTLASRARRLIEQNFQIHNNAAQLRALFRMNGVAEPGALQEAR